MLKRIGHKVSGRRFLGQIIDRLFGGEEGDRVEQNRRPAGDFNAVPRSQSFNKITSRLKTATARRLPLTFPSRFPLLRLDHVFHDDGLEMLDISPVATPAARVASDHLPLLADFALPQRSDADLPARVIEPEFT